MFNISLSAKKLLSVKQIEFKMEQFVVLSAKPAYYAATQYYVIAHGT